MKKNELINKVVNTAKEYQGAAEGSAKHKEIIKEWNSLSGIPGKAGLSTPWCAIYVSVIFAEAGCGALVKPEWNCAALRDDFIKAGGWIENESTVPEVGDVIIYNWDDGANYASTDNKGSADHTGIVISVSDSKKTFQVIEGNYGSSHSCAVRRMNVNGRYLRGFGRPAWDKLADPEEKKEETAAPGYDKSGIAYAKSFDKNLSGTWRVNSFDGLNLRNAPGTGKYLNLKTKVLAVIPNKGLVQCYGFYTAFDGYKWYLVKYGKYTGFACGAYLRRA